MEDTARFTALVAGPEAELPLDEAAFLIAAHDHKVDVGSELRRLDELADGMRAPTVDEVRRVLFTDLGLAGDADDYYAPENSYLDAVLDRRRGIPITLTVLMMEVGRRAGVTIHGIGAPGHFLAMHGEQLLDPFAGGVPTQADGVHPSYLAPVGPRAILARMLANLRQIYQTTGDFTSLLWVLRLRCAIPGVPDADHDQLARMEASLN
ncbi:MAG: transglutaminase family protein [Actinobacteria bacterium]|nr:transglutaminase family protein [Actinomycetota bacterium]MBV9663053.1 transglutaminase family protein [Actinomycetota bacterium]MBV9933357.1 transglutaminase family protein [Actinomycetota bacterium]